MYLECTPERSCLFHVHYASLPSAARMPRVHMLPQERVAESYIVPPPVFAYAVYKQLGKLHCLHEDNQMCQLVNALKERGARLLTPRRPTAKGAG